MRFRFISRPEPALAIRHAAARADCRDMMESLPFDVDAMHKPY